MSSWIRFKLNDTGLEFLGNKNSSIDENDQKKVNSFFEFFFNNSFIMLKNNKKVTDLRNWIKTNPCLDALIEAKLCKMIPCSSFLSNAESNQGVSSSIDQNKSMASSLTNSSQVEFIKSFLYNLRPVTFSKISEGFLDVICQVKCDTPKKYLRSNSFNQKCFKGMCNLQEKWVLFYNCLGRDLYKVNFAHIFQIWCFFKFIIF